MMDRNWYISKFSVQFYQDEQVCRKKYKFCRKVLNKKITKPLIYCPRKSQGHIFLLTSLLGWLLAVSSASHQLKFLHSKSTWFLASSLISSKPLIHLLITLSKLNCPFLEMFSFLVFNLISFNYLSYSAFLSFWNFFYLDKAFCVTKY